jgi:hypothetical protein
VSGFTINPRVSRVLFYTRNLKPAGRQHLTRLALAGRLLEDLTVLVGASAWPTPRGP